MAQVVRGMIGFGLVAGASVLPLAAQSMALPAADPVGIARSGAQVAYGYSLEAAALNPALLASLKGKGGFYLAGGLEMASSQQTLESTQLQNFSEDRNRAIGAFGFAARLRPSWTLGLKVDEPYLRHGKLNSQAPSRFQGDGIDLSAHRAELQSAWAFGPNVSLGVGLGVARLAYDATNVVRLNVPDAPLPDVLVEHRVGQGGSKVVPSYSVGLRWAPNPRWTFGLAHQSSLKGDLDLSAELRNGPLGYFAYDGLSVAPAGTPALAAPILASARAVAGKGTMELPSQTTLGLRHRLSPMVTWEADLRWTSGQTQVPTFAAIQTSVGLAGAPRELAQTKGYLSMHLSTEVELGKAWTVRGGLSFDQPSAESADFSPLLGGPRTTAFSIGGGYKVWGGELNLGYQYRQSQDQDLRTLDGTWSANGYRPVGTRVRLEGMGHLMAFGFKKTF